MSNYVMPVVPDIPSDLDPELRSFLTAAKETLETWLGDRGDDLDKVVTFRDLADMDMVAEDGSASAPSTPFTDETSIDPPTDLVITPGTWTNTLTWTNPDEEHLSHIEVWTHTSNSVTEATRAAVVSAPTQEYVHNVEYVTHDNFYWIRAVSYAGNYSVWTPRPSHGGYLVNAHETIGAAIDNAIHTLKGADPAEYDAGTAYEAGELVTYTVSGEQRRYRRLDFQNTDTGVLPTVTTHWERVGILMTGEVDGEATVGIDGNLVVDDSILARSIQTSTLTVGDGTGHSIICQEGVLTISNFTEADQDKVDNTPWQHEDDATTIDGGKIYAGSEVIIGDNDIILQGQDDKTEGIIIAESGATLDGTTRLPTDTDYMLLNDAGIKFFSFNGSDHNEYNSLRRFEMGTATARAKDGSGNWVGDATELPGIWKSQPRILVSPRECVIYDPTYSTQQQVLRCFVDDADVTKTGSNPDTYSFYPTLELATQATTQVEQISTLTSGQKGKSSSTAGLTANHYVYTDSITLAANTSTVHVDLSVYFDVTWPWHTDTVYYYIDGVQYGLHSSTWYQSYGTRYRVLSLASQAVTIPVDGNTHTISFGFHSYMNNGNQTHTINSDPASGYGITSFKTSTQGVSISISSTDVNYIAYE